MSTRFDDARWLAAGVIAVALVIRLAAIDSRLSLDDAYSWYAASAPSAGIFLHRLAAYENTPPLIYLILAVLPGSSPVWLRLPSVIAGALLAWIVLRLLRPRVGTRPALLAALSTAVAPYLVTYSDFARGFMLADLALLGGLWALVALGERETRGRWVAFVACGVVAVWSEYASVITWAAIVLGGLWTGRPNRVRLLLLGGAAAATLVAWLPEIVRGQDQVGITKLTPQTANPSLSAARNMVVTLAFGEHGGTSSGVLRWLAVLLAVGLAAAGGWCVRRRWAGYAAPARRLIRLLGGVLLLTPVGYAIAAPFGVDVFTQRYITILVPVAAALAAVAIDGLSLRVVLVLGVALLLFGIANFAKRLGAEFQPDLTPVRAAVLAAHPRQVLTNSPQVAYALQGLPVSFDRPVNLGAGRQATCATPCVAADDLVGIFGGPPRSMAGTRHVFAGRYVVVVRR